MELYFYEEYMKQIKTYDKSAYVDTYCNVARNYTSLGDFGFYKFASKKIVAMAVDVRTDKHERFQICIAYVNWYHINMSDK
jgi:hypothetical protein